MSERSALGRELLDRMEEPGPGKGFARASYRTMARVNRLLGCTRAVRQFVALQTQRLEKARPLRVLDIGAGDCALAIETLERTRRAGSKVAFTCVEPNRDALALARERLRERPDLNITLVPERIEEHQPDEPYDCAVGSLFFHHFDDRDILQLLQRLSSYVRGSVLINDLRRGPAPFIAFMLLSPVLPSGVCRDGLLSIRRGFTPSGLKHLLDRLPCSSARICGTNTFRVTARVVFHGQESSAQQNRVGGQTGPERHHQA